MACSAAQQVYLAYQLINPPLPLTQLVLQPLNACVERTWLC